MMKYCELKLLKAISIGLHPGNYGIGQVNLQQLDLPAPRHSPVRETAECMIQYNQPALANPFDQRPYLTHVRRRNLRHTRRSAWPSFFFSFCAADVL